MKAMILILITALLVSGCGPERKEEGLKSIKSQAELKAASERISELEKKVARASEIEAKADALIATLQAENRNLIADVASLNGQLALANSKMDSMRQLGRAEGHLDALIKPSTVSSNYMPSQPAYTKQPDPEPPPWRYPTADEARKIIRKTAQEKWGEDFQMVEHVIKTQTEAYQSIGFYEKKRWSNPVLRRLLNKAGNKWSPDFQMVLHVIEQQLEAKDRLETKR